MSHQSNIRRLIFASMMAAVVYVASAFFAAFYPNGNRYDPNTFG